MFSLFMNSMFMLLYIVMNSSYRYHLGLYWIVLLFLFRKSDISFIVRVVVSTSSSKILFRFSIPAFLLIIWRMGFFYGGCISVKVHFIIR